MNRHIVLSAAVSAALHVGLLCGLGGGKPPVIAPVKDLIKIVYDPLPNVVAAEPPEHDPLADPQPQGRPEPLVPRSADVPVANPGPFVVATQPDIISVIKSVPSIEAGSLGIPGGVGAGFGPGVLSSRSLDSPPIVKIRIAPQYPFEARRAGRAGEVVVEFIVDEEGRVVAPRVVQTTNREFDENALRAVAKWRFERGRRDGRVVSFRMMVPIVFTID